MQKFVAVEGNIGSGKSTFLPMLVEALGADWEALQEPVDDPEFTRLLKAFYDNPTCPNTRIEFQMYITNRRSELVKDLDHTKNYVIERSLLSDLIFSQCNFLDMEQPDASYMHYYYDIKRRLRDYPKINCCLYLQTDPEIAYGRVLKRARGAENSIELSYMEDLHRFHEASLPQICRMYDVPLLTYNWDDFGSTEWVAKNVRAICEIS